MPRRQNVLSTCESWSFLGQWITTRGVAPVKGKLNAVREWETPTSVKDIRSFLGFANYYRRFVPGYASIVAPLTMLTKKDVLWHWGPLQRRAFEDLKSALCTAPLLSIQIRHYHTQLCQTLLEMLLEEY